MSRAHTPGPWAAKPTMLRAVAIVSASGPVATTSSASHVSREINIANARVIAAAPELLAALQAAVDALSSDVSEAPMPEVYARLAQAWLRGKFEAAARAAIAKATGEG